ncbi:unnamed protein product [Lupinus luteus]|uniref:S-protein homolog n=1 Tax=Lupinus luteus TaxID=3873 RepID=A0AAV1WQH0_LUPLU
MVKVGNGSMIHIFTFLQLLLLGSLIAVSEGSIFSRPRRHVHIVNFLGYNISLNVHCKSEDIDLGFHDVSYGFKFDFEFLPKIIGKTSFFCDLKWQGKFHSANVFNSRADSERCAKNCYWSVESDQLCTWGDAGKEVCTPWK